MSAKLARERVPEWKGALPNFRFEETIDGAYVGHIIWEQKILFSYSSAKMNYVRAALEEHRIYIMKDILEGKI